LSQALTDMQLLPAPSMATEVMAARDLSVAALVDAVGLGLRLQAFSLALRNNVWK